ncbi:Fe2+-dependent dioxygenase [Advenella mimigardefordensis]|uniref:Putative PKHD-type hydroxylase n=1 Tax=Advenella mimigardefordensis (strain DSM 17166 / LMG 22922 / DPN7) TaxID=1247726 RepID=W0PCS2_ADVMD|nr:Fe2+-dependent dioxygenase [Advenella mimigardefordensis]AHG64556.1 putative PKHD-type hydroxylase [Advenella mimigardefordensis DPN7]
MLVNIPDLLSADVVMQLRKQLGLGQWVDGRGTSGYIAASQKKNLQLAETDPQAISVGNHILDKLSQNARFISATLPLKILSPMFNAYASEQEYGFHIDNAIRVDPHTGERIRADISATLFLSEPDEYEGGELIIQDTYGEQRVKMPAGHMVVYPSTSLHRVTPVTRGKRVAAVLWIQSMVCDDAQRAMLFEMDNTIQQLAGELGEHSSVVSLTGIYHNLVRRWASV